MGPDAAFELLETAGVSVAPWRYARSAEECAHAVHLAGPCVVKADIAGVVHKTEEGAVRLGIADVDAAAAVYREFERRFGDRLDGVVVQAQVPAGLELRSEATRDPALGPFVVVGAGGVEAERPGRSGRARRSDLGRRGSRRSRGTAPRPTVPRLPRPAGSCLSTQSSSS